MAEDRIEWNTKELEAFTKSLRHDKSGRALKAQMEAQFDSITETFRDRLREDVAQIRGAGEYPSELADLAYKTRLIGGKKARVSIIGEGKTRNGKWREIGKFLDKGFLYHPAWGHWRDNPPPAYLRQEVPDAPRTVDDLLEHSTPQMRDDIRSVLNDYLDRLTDIRRGL